MATRSYLRSEDRRQQLIEAASRLFDAGGFAAVTMVAVAREAGVSRRLLYDHFADLDELNAAVFFDRTTALVRTLDTAATEGRDPGDRSTPQAVAALLDVSPGELRAIQLVLASAGGDGLDRAREQLRTHLTVRWLPLLSPAPLDPTTAAGLLWAAAAAVVAIVDQLHRGEIDRTQAEVLAGAVAVGLQQAAATLAPAPIPIPTTTGALA